VLPARIEEKITYEPMSGCWLWTAALDGKGYGMVWWRGQMRRAHIVVYEILVGEVPEGLERDHLCQNRACCNPWLHIEPVTHEENCWRGETGAHNAEKTHCPQGHEYAIEAYEIPSRPGARYCQGCNRERSRERRARMKQLVTLLTQKGLL